MDRGLWITWYDLPDAGREEHLAWVHGSYIPRQLKRPGFHWAAHYVTEKQPEAVHSRLRHTTDSAVPSGNDYILIFGAATAHAYADPIPGKTRPEPSQEERRMMAMRSGARVNIYAEEARTDGPDVQLRGNAGLSPCIQLGSFNAGAWQDENELLSWYAGFRLPGMAATPGCIGIRKLVSVSGWAKHGVLYEFVSKEARSAHFRAHENADPELAAWTDRLVRTLVHAPGSANTAYRIWPEVK